MVKILKRAIGWIRHHRTKHRCYFCSIGVRELHPDLMYVYKDMIACPRCFDRPYVIYALDTAYWVRHPNATPPCMHCDNVVPWDRLMPAVCQDWYFYEKCVLIPEVLRYYRKLRDRLEGVE